MAQRVCFIFTSFPAHTLWYWVFFHTDSSIKEVDFYFCGTITPAFPLYHYASTATFKISKHSFIQPQSKAPLVLYLVNASVPSAPARWHDCHRGVLYLSCWSLSVGRCPYISFQSACPWCLSLLLKLFLLSLLIFESLVSLQASGLLLESDSSGSEFNRMGKKNMSLVQWQNDFNTLQ